MFLYNIVSKHKIINEFKKSKYFKLNLGTSYSLPGNSGKRILNKKDEFAYYYNTNYKTILIPQGNIGDIRFYIDYYISKDVLAFYYKYEEFIFDFEYNKVAEMGIDKYLGYLIKSVEELYNSRMEEIEKRKIEKENKVGDPDMIFKNPGSVTYEDLKAYFQKQNENRYGV